MLIIEFLERKGFNWEKVAECPAAEVFDLSPDRAASFWDIQDIHDRAIMLRLEDERHNK